MTTTSLRATVRRRINQTSNTDTNVPDTMIDELGNQARRMFAAILPDSILTTLRSTTSLSPSSGLASYPSDYLRGLDDPGHLIDGVQARIIPKGEKWRLKFINANINTASGAADKYIWETDNGVQCLPTDATTITFKYVRVPDDLDGDANADMPLDVDDMVVDFVFEKAMGTPQMSDYELATVLARNRGYLLKEVQNVNI